MLKFIDAVLLKILQLILKLFDVSDHGNTQLH